MSHDEIVTQLSQRIPPEVIYAITPRNILTAIVQRMGEEPEGVSDLEGIDWFSAYHATIDLGPSVIYY